MKSKKMTPIEFSSYIESKVKSILNEDGANVLSFKYITITEGQNGLMINYNQEGKKEIENALQDQMPDSQIWYELFDDVQGNSEYNFHYDMGEDGFGLTNAPGITDGYYMANSNRNKWTTDYPESAEVYWYPDYMVKDPLEELKETGKVFFTKIN